MDILEYIENNYEGWEIAEDGRFLYNLGSEDQETLILGMKSKSLIELPSDMNNCLLFYEQSESDERIICASDCIINIYNYSVNKCTLIKSIEAHDYSITSLIKTDKYIISASNDETIKLWSLDNFDMVYTFNHNDDVLCINYNDNYLVSGDFQGVVKVWNLETFKLIKEINVNEYIVSVAISNKLIALSTSKSKLYIYDFECNNSNHKYVFSNQERYIYFLQFSSDNNYLYSGTADDLIMYSTYDFKILNNYKHQNFVNSHCLTKDNYKILYVDEKKLDYIYTPVFHNFIFNILSSHIPHELISLIIKYL